MRTRKYFWGLALALLLIVQLACEEMDRELCRWNGGTWVYGDSRTPDICVPQHTAPEVDAPMENPASTEEPAASAAEVDLLSIEETKSICMVNMGTINWEYLDIQRDEVDGNVACNARLYLRNTDSDKVVAMIASDWDNGVEQKRTWEIQELPPGGDWSFLVNETRTSQITYIRATDLLLVKDIPECDPLIHNGQESLWEELATSIEPFTCP